MPKIDDLTIQRVKDAARIEEVIGDFVTLRKAGVNLTGLCPFHNDTHTGNFIVSPRGKRKYGNRYHCFVCGADGDAVDFLTKHEGLSFPDAIRYLGKMTCIEVDNVPVNYTPPPPPPPPPPLPDMVMPREWVLKLNRKHYDNNFIRWLYSLPWSDEARARLQQTLWQYCVAGTRNGWVMFWQIDEQGVVRCGKMMLYQDDGHRNKEKKNHPRWLYNQPGHYNERGDYIPGPRDILKPDEHRILHPLFGMHLLNKHPDAVVNVVESEKTAVIMANYYGQPDAQLWMACGGLSWLDDNLDSMQPLIDQGRTVWLWPDRDGVEKWQQVCDKLGADNVRVYTDFFRTSYVPEDDGPKADIADIAIRLMGGGRLPEQHNEQNHTGDPQPPTRVGTGGSAAATPDPSAGERPDGVSDEEWLEHTAIMKAIREWNLTHVPDEPFPGNTPLQQLLHDRVEESKRKRKEKQKNEQQQQSDRQG